MKKLLDASDQELFDIRGKTDDELKQIIEDQQRRIDALDQENVKLGSTIYRMKKQLRQIASM